MSCFFVPGVSLLYDVFLKKKVFGVWCIVWCLFVYGVSDGCFSYAFYVSICCLVCDVFVCCCMLIWSFCMVCL